MGEGSALAGMAERLGSTPRPHMVTFQCQISPPHQLAAIDVLRRVSILGRRKCKNLSMDTPCRMHAIMITYTSIL